MYAETIRRALHAVAATSQPSEELIDVLTELLVGRAPAAECPKCAAIRDAHLERRRLRREVAAMLGITGDQVAERYGESLNVLRRLAAGEQVEPKRRPG